MRALSLITLALTSLLSTAQWVAIDQMPLPSRDDGVAFSFKDTALIGTGMNAGFQTTRNFASYSIKFGWNSAPSLPAGEERQYATAWSYLNIGFVLGGISNGNLYRDLWMFNLKTNQWSPGAALPGSPRYGCTAFKLDTEIYVLGGVDTTGKATSEVWVYDLINDTWHREADAPFSVFRGTSHVVGDTAYVFFGRDQNGDYRNEVYTYSKVRGWMQRTSFPNLGRSHVATYLNTNNHSITLVGGSDSANVFYSDIWDYNYITDSWQEQNWTFPIAVRGGYAFELGDDKFYAGGLTPTGRVQNAFHTNYGTTSLQPSGSFLLLGNPSRNKIRFSPSAPTCLISIWNICGQQTLYNDDFNTAEEIDISTWPSGVYIIHISNETIGSSVLRLVVP